MTTSRQLQNYEPLLLFALIFLPGYLSQTMAQNSAELFNNGFLLFFYLLTAVPQAFLVFYLIRRDGLIPPGVYGLVPLTGRTLLRVLPSLAGVFVVLVPVYLVSMLFFITGFSVPWETVDWQFRRPLLIPLVLLACLGTGYLEEIFFRSYLATKMEFQGISRRRALLFLNLLFASGHLYQGIPGFLGTFAIGIYMTLLFYRDRNLHLIAITHGLYNFSILMVSFILGARDWP